jgi:hypothetical protein
VSERDGPLHGSYWVVPGRLLAGRCPGLHQDEAGARAELGALRAAGVELFVDLTEGREYGLRPYDGLLSAPAVYRRHAIPDFGVTTPVAMREILDVIDGALDEGLGVYVHCYAGIGRTGTVMCCYLVRHGMDPREAMRTCSRWRGVRSPQSDEQEDFVLGWREPSLQNRHEVGTDT